MKPVPAHLCDTVKVAFLVHQDMASEDLQALQDVMLRALSEYSPAKMTDAELTAVCKLAVDTED